jgi:hypothetical protein
MPAASYQYYAGGQWRDAEGKAQFDVFQPYDRAVFAPVAAGGAKEAQVAIEAAAAAFPAWSQTTPAERAKLFFKAAEIVKRRRTEIARVLALETGSTISLGPGGRYPQGTREVRQQESVTARGLHPHNFRLPSYSGLYMRGNWKGATASCTCEWMVSSFSTILAASECGVKPAISYTAP